MGNGWPLPDWFQPKEEISVDQMLKDAWDEDFKNIKGYYPPFSRLVPVFYSHGLRELGDPEPPPCICGLCVVDRRVPPG